ncbi:MAG: rhomboid family intramembrane serine protease [Verrucomicrobia bacterium]|nr:rhomboid family intramembrane serine protease [Verrucomicrobiota bacterium]
MTPTVRILLIANIAVFFLGFVVDLAFFPGFTETLFGLSLPGVRSGFVWQLVSYMFLHANGMHLIFNMLVLFMIGPETERGMGRRHFTIMYFLSGILGGASWLLINPRGVCVGASGAVFGILAAFATLYPQRRITLLVFFILPVTMRAWVMAAGLALMELIMLVGQSGGRIAHGVHLAGAIAAYVYTSTVFRGMGSGLRVFRIGRRRSPRRSGEGDSFDMKEVDRLLDKIASEGIHSLTSRERAFLQKVSRENRTGR